MSSLMMNRMFGLLFLGMLPFQRLLGSSGLVAICSVGLTLRHSVARTHSDGHQLNRDRPPTRFEPVSWDKTLHRPHQTTGEEGKRDTTLDGVRAVLLSRRL